MGGVAVDVLGGEVEEAPAGDRCQPVVPGPVVPQLRLLQVRGGAVVLGADPPGGPRKVESVTFPRAVGDTPLHLRCGQAAVRHPEPEPALHRRLGPPVYQVDQLTRLNDSSATSLAIEFRRQ